MKLVERLIMRNIRFLHAIGFTNLSDDEVIDLWGRSLRGRLMWWKRVARAVTIMHLAIIAALMITWKTWSQTPFARFFDLDCLSFWGDVVPSFVATFSFSFAATRYYLDVVSSIDLRKLGRVRERWLRAQSFVFTLPVIAALLIPQSWPFCSALGIWFVAANNMSLYKLAKEAQRKILPVLPADPRDEIIDNPSSPSIDDFMRGFFNWAYMLPVYGAILVGLGFLLLMGVAQDVWIYGILVGVFANYFLIVVMKCQREGRRIRYSFDRLFTGLERVQDNERSPYGV